MQVLTNFSRLQPTTITQDLVIWVVSRGWEIFEENQYYLKVRTSGKSDKEKCKRSFPPFATFHSSNFPVFTVADFILASVEFNLFSFTLFLTVIEATFQFTFPPFTVHGKLQLSSGQAIRQNQQTDRPRTVMSHTDPRNQIDWLTDWLTNRFTYRLNLTELTNKTTYWLDNKTESDWLNDRPLTDWRTGN